MPPSRTENRRIKIEVDAKGATDLKRIADGMAGVNRNTKQMATSLGTLQNLFSGLFAANIFGFGIREVANMADEMSMLNDRLKVLSGGSEQAAEVMEKLGRASKRTNTPIANLAQAYSRLASATKGSGVSSDSLIAITETLTNTFRLSGASVTETTNTMIQLSQAFSSGQLRGQELRSVMEQNAYVAGLLRKEFGADIYKKAADGAITLTDVLRIILRDQDNIAKQAKELKPTFEQTYLLFLDKIKGKINEFNQQFNVNDKFKQFADYIIERFNDIILVVEILAISAIPKLIASFATLVAANPVTALVSSAAMAFLNLRSAIEGVNLKSFDAVNAKLKETEAQIAKLQGPKTQGGILRDMVDFANVGKGVTYSGPKLADLEKEATKYRTALAEITKEEEKAKEAGRKKLTQELEAMRVEQERLAELSNPLISLNREYEKGAISVGDYAAKLQQLNIDKFSQGFKKGEKSAFELKKELNELKLSKLTAAFFDGSLAASEYGQRVREIKLDELKDKALQGKGTLREYNEELLKIGNVSQWEAAKVGAQNYFEEVKNLSLQTAGAMTKVFQSLEDSLTTSLVNLKLDFKDFVDTIINELARIAIQKSIMQPLGEYLGGKGLFSPIGAGGDVGAGAPAAIQTSPGVGAAAGSNFITPFSSKMLVNENLGLTPMSSQSPVTVNVVNNSKDNEITTQESTGPNGERVLDVIIESRVKQSIASGKLDRTFQQAFGLQRRGS